MKTLKSIIQFSCIITAILLTSCATSVHKSKTYAKMYQAKPASILVLPPINKSTNVEAKEIFYSSLSAPICQKGFYVLPPLLAMTVLKEESAYDTEMFLNSSMQRVGDMFGVDAVLFTTIIDWKKVSIASYIEVEIEYILKSTKTDEILFRRKGNVTYSPQNVNGGLLGLVANSIVTALTKEVTIAEQCNNYTFTDMPAGPYNTEEYINDSSTVSGPEEFKVRLQ